MRAIRQILLGAAVLVTGALAQAPLPSTPAPEAPLPSADPQQLRSLAERRYAEGELSEAVRLFEAAAAAEDDPDEKARTLLTASWLHHQQGDAPAAEEALRRSLFLSPGLDVDPGLYSPDFERLLRQAQAGAQVERRELAAKRRQQALAHLEAGRFVAARTELGAALELDSRDALATYNLALLDLREGRDHPALEGFARVLDLTAEGGEPIPGLRARSLSSVGLLHYRSGRWSEAAGAFRRSVELDPADPVTWRNLGLALSRTAAADEALAAYRRGYELRPEDLELARLYGQALLDAGRFDEAARVAGDAGRRHPADAAVQLQLGLAEASRGGAAVAAEAWARAVALDRAVGFDTGRLAAFHLALLHHEAGRHDEAAAVARQALDRRPDDARLWNLVGLASQAAGRLDRALEGFVRASSLDDGQADYPNNLGGVYAALRDYGKAEEAFVRALTLDPEHAEARANLERVRAANAGASPAPRSVSPAATARPAAAPPPPRGKPIKPKQVGLKFADLDYDKLRLRGALVKEVAKRSPAARAGLRRGDLLLRVGDYEIVSAKDFFQYLKRNPLRGQIDVELLRNGATDTFRLDLGQR